MKIKNIDMEKRVLDLEKYLDRKDVIGYAAARNTRILKEQLTEFSERKEELVRLYGKEDKDENGELTGTITVDRTSPDFQKFIEKIEKFALIEHEIEPFKLKYKDAIGELTGNELVELEWMFED